MGTEHVLDNISQNRMRKELLISCVNGNAIVLVLFFFQISDQIFRDKWECVTKIEEMFLNEEDAALVQYYSFF